LAAVDEFSVVLYQAIQEGLGAFGETGKAVMWHVQRMMIAEQPEAFVKELRTIFGVQGSWVFEDAVLRKLHEKLGLEYDGNSNLTFEEHVQQLRALYAQKTGPRGQLER